MNKSEFESLKETSSEPEKVCVSELGNKVDRTLIYGYTLNRDTVHIYLQGLLIHRYVYDHNGKTLIAEVEDHILLENCNPSKRAYPECCDAEFSRLVLSKGGHITFTTFNEGRLPQRFHGETL